MPKEPNSNLTNPTQGHQEATPPTPSADSSEPTYITVSKLIGKPNWSKAMVRDLLGDPDQQARNPRYRTGPPMLLYDLKRVEEAEATPEFALRLAQYELKRQTGLRISRAKRDKLIADVRQIEIRYGFDMTVEEARQNGLRAWAESEDEKTSQRGNFDGPASRNPEHYDPADIDRWTVNCLRHERSGYEAILNGIHGLVGRRLADPIIKNRVLLHISDIFPELAPAAHLQLVPEEPGPPAGPEE